MSLQTKAHQATKTAIWNGRLTPSNCETCDSEFVVAHHDDYHFPLAVRWLCQGCHVKWHRVNGPGRGADLSSLASRIERWGIIHQFPSSYVAALRSSISETGTYMGSNGPEVASEALYRSLFTKVA